MIGLEMLEFVIYSVFVVVAAMLGLIAHQMQKAMRNFKAPTYNDDAGELPSVTVCIPARNEQHALAYCLEKVVASTYEKLEIIVLDDVSGDDTSALIKSFASDGVRFVQGNPLPEGWLGKNHALQGLLNEASGTFVLFMDVDTRLAPRAIENMVRYTLQHQATMVSVLPRREDGWRASVLFSPLRYFWELIFNRHLSPASASNAWLMSREALADQFQGFHALKNAIQPEAKIADVLSAKGAYKFLIGSEAFGVAYEKKWRSQLLTSTRLLFPLLNSSVLISLLAVIALAFFLLPFVVLVNGFVVGFEFLHLTAAVLIIVSYGLYATYVKHVWKSGWLVGMLLWPLLLVQEACLVVASVIQYKRKSVIWKGRIIRPEARN